MQKTLYAEFTVKPGAEARVSEMMSELAAKVRDERGNVLFLPYTQESDPNRYFVFEIYEDETAFATHLAADHGATFNAELADLIADGASQLTFLKPLKEAVQPA